MKKINLRLVSTLALSGILGTGTYANSSAATPATTEANRKIFSSLPFSDTAEFSDAARGLLLQPPTLTIKNDQGTVIWDLESYKSFIQQNSTAPSSVNPSLWRNAQLNLHYGLFEVVDGIYQVRGYDLANITFVRGNTGWIVFDVGSTAETAKAAYDLITQHFGKKPIVAAVYSHPHLDHYAGIKGLVSEEDVRSGKVRLLAPEGFMEHAVSENVITGNAMSRRAIFMYGAFLPRNAQGSVGAGLGMTNPRGTTTLIEPNEIIGKTGQKIVIDGVEMEFQMTPGTEAPAEMNTYFPQKRALWMAENTTSTMHNILTLRGAQVRDSLGWAKYIQQTIELYGDKVDVKFQSHHWPKWGQDQVLDYFKKQRDLYKFIHDRSVNLINKGYTGDEIAELIKLPNSLENFWPGRGYYGTLRHNSRAVYQRYMGWYTGNPSDLNALPNEDAAKKYVEYMGGEAAIMARAQTDFDKGKYRWLATALRHVVFNNPNNQAAKELLAKSYEQLGYQAESGPWRSIYLQGAYELRNGTPKATGGSASPDVVKAMSPEMLFDFLAVRLNADKAEGKKLSINMNFTDLGENYHLSVENSVLNYSKFQPKNVDATVTMTKAALDNINTGASNIENEIKAGNIRVTGQAEALRNLMGMLDNFHPDFNIILP